MPFIGAIIGAVAPTVIGGLMGGGGGGQQVGTGIAQVAGGALSASQAQKFADEVKQTANPYGNYMPEAAQRLAAGGQTGTYANPGSSSGLGSTWGLGNYLNTVTQPITGQLNNVGATLNNLVANPGSIFQDPAYKAAFGQGESAVNSTLAAQGLNASGNQLAALQNYGQSFGQNAYNNRINQLSSLYGLNLAANQQAFGQGLALNNQAYSQGAQMSGLAGANLGAAAKAQADVFGNISAAGQGVGQGIGNIASGLGELFSGGDNSTGTGPIGSDNPSISGDQFIPYSGAGNIGDMLSGIGAGSYIPSGGGF